MEHIYQFDWCSDQYDTNIFVQEEDLDHHCVTEKILRNKFYDPLVSSDDETEDKPHFNWSEIFKKAAENASKPRIFVPGLHKCVQSPKLSALTQQQHYQCLKVLCADNPNILEAVFIGRPTKADHKVYKEVKEIYEKEQQEYIAWAQKLWSTDHCVRALRPKPPIEAVYEAEFNIIAHEMNSFPKSYEMAGQLSIEAANGNFEFVFEKNLINVNPAELPYIDCTDIFSKRFTILNEKSSPQPCDKHPCKFILPFEKSPSVLPVTEVHRQLGSWAADAGADCVCSEAALQALLQRDATWLLPLTVTEVMGTDGRNKNVIVIGSKFSSHKEPAIQRTYRAYRHMLQNTLIPTQEKIKYFPSSNDLELEDISDTEENFNDQPVDSVLLELSSDEEENNLFIDEEQEDDNTANMEIDEDASEVQASEDKHVEEPVENNNKEGDKEENKTDETISKKIGVYKCTCKGTMFERPPPRSFEKWRVKNNSNNSSYDVIVHCSHKVRNEAGEVILEPKVEYQIDLGASKQSEDKIRSLALSLLLRKNATLMNVRVDGVTGDLVTCEPANLEQLAPDLQQLAGSVGGTLHTMLQQLQGLLPGHYVLQHEPSHGSNVFLYAPRNTGSLQKLTLDFDRSRLDHGDETKQMKDPPTLIPALLPMHKHRKILPCAFTIYPNQVAKERKKPPAKPKAPPPALKLGGAEATGKQERQFPRRRRVRDRKKKQN